MSYSNKEILNILVGGTFDKEISLGGVVSRVRPLLKYSSKQINVMSESAILTSISLQKQPEGFMKSLLQRSTADQLMEITEELSFRQ